MKVLTQIQVVDEFVGLLKKNRAKVARIASFGNSFEGWLKFEFAALLHERHARRPWMDGTLRKKHGDVGLEWRAETKSDAYPYDRKLIDLWVSSQAGGDRFHCVELKVVINNPNRRKQLRSWRRDLDALNAVSHRDVDGRIIVLVAVDFSRDELTRLGVQEATEICAHSERGQHSTPAVHVAFDTHPKVATPRSGKLASRVGPKRWLR